jgi:hypothetical protein
MPTNSIIDNVEVINDHGKRGSQYQGYRFNMRKRGEYIIVKMDNRQNCCEDWSIFSNVVGDNFSSFIGREIISIEYKPNDKKKSDNKEMNRALLKIVTLDNASNKKRTIKIVLENEHNGYYAHEYIVHWNLTILGEKIESNNIESL